MPRSRIFSFLYFGLSRPFSLLCVTFLVGLLLFVPGCGGGPEQEGCQKPKDLLGLSVKALIICKPRQDTGYRRGKAFPITVVTVDGKPVERKTANAYYVMQQAAAKAGVAIRIVSGFRTMAQQQYLYNCYLTKKCNNGNLAARPGYSNHQSGHALDLNTRASGVYHWLTANGGKFGFKRTIPSEKWHWEWWSGGPGGGPCQSTCTPKCTTKTKFVGKDCKAGDCSAFGAYCTNDKLGLRCYSAFCPALGSTNVCVKGQIGTCKDGKLSLIKCPAGKTCGSKPIVACVGAQKAKGSLKAGCDGISGWAQDPDQPTKSIVVQLFFGGPAGSSKASRLTLNANQYNSGLCKSLGSCKHAFSSRTPRSYLDGKPHLIYGYALDSETGALQALASSPTTLQCPYVAPQGLLRYVPSPASFAAWRFSSLWDVLSVLDSDLMTLQKGPAIPSSPILVQADNGKPEVWLIDGSWRRFVSGPAVLTAWRWSGKSIKVWPASKVYAFTKGTSWPPLPTLVKGSKDEVYLLDTPQSTTPPQEKPPLPESAPSSDGGTASERGSTLSDTGGLSTEQGSDSSSRQGRVLVLDGDLGGHLQPRQKSGCNCSTSSKNSPTSLWVLLFWVGLWSRQRSFKPSGRSG